MFGLIPVTLSANWLHVDVRASILLLMYAVSMDCLLLAVLLSFLLIILISGFSLCHRTLSITMEFEITTIFLGSLSKQINEAQCFEFTVQVYTYAHIRTHTQPWPCVLLFASIFFIKSMPKGSPPSLE